MVRDGMTWYDMVRDGTYGMSVFTTYPPERSNFGGYGDGADFWQKAQQLRGMYAHHKT